MSLEIKTERLLLRPFTSDDAPRLVELVSAWDVARMTSRIPHPYSPDLAATWIASHVSGRAAGTDYPLAITRDGQIIGCTGLSRAPGKDWGLAGDILEIGYWIGVPYWGRGYASEAAGAMIAWGFGDLNQPVLGAGHFADNPVSRRVLEKLGFTPAGQRRMASAARGTDVDCPLLLLTRDTWVVSLGSAKSGIK